MSKPITPHGPGFTFIDSVEIIEKGRSLRATKWLDPKLPFFADHFPGAPIMPGVLMVEAAAQAAGALWGSGDDTDAPRVRVLAKVQDFRFKKPVFPGQTLQLDITLEKNLGTLAQFGAVLSVEGKAVANGSVILSSNHPKS